MTTTTYRFIACFAAASLLSCAARQNTATNAPPPPEKMKIINGSQFDVGTCFPRTLDVVDPANLQAITGFLVAHRPQALECLVDPKSRGPEKLTKVKITTTVSENGTDNAVTGDNVTPAGIACIKGILDAANAFKPLKKGAAPVSGNAEFNHDTSISPTVTFGTNEASDMVGNIRLGEKSWCDCFTDWKAAAPHLLRVTIKVTKAPVTPESQEAPTPKAAVTLEPTNDPSTAGIGACLKGKIEALPYTMKSQEITIPYKFVTVNSSVSDDLPADQDDYKLLQIDGVRSQRAADTAIAMGARVNAVDVYNALTDRYQKKHESSLVKDLKAKCAALLKADDTWASSLDRQFDVDKRAVALVQALQAKNPDDKSWNDAVAAGQKSADGTQADINELKKMRSQDAAACPREHY
jgi:hypothetical protein